MAYSKSTEFYHLPFMGYGDMITEEEEMRQMSIIDNLLYASMLGSNKCIIDEGEYSVSEEPGGCKLVISPSPNGISIMGILNYRLFMSNSKIESSVFNRGDETFFYVSYSESLETDCRIFSINGFSYKLDDSDPQFLYLARVWFEGNSIKIETNEGKVYRKNIFSHMADSVNPHGPILHQNSIDISDSLEVEGNKVFGAFYGEIPSPGTKGIQINVPNGFSMVFLTAFPSSPSNGQVSWKIDGEKVMLFNSGSTEGTIHFKMEVKRK